MLAVIALCLGVLQEPTVTVSLNAMPLSAAISELSGLTGRNLSVSRALGECVICLQMNAVPAHEVLDKVADCLDATWTKEEGGERLIRTVKQSRDIEREDFQARIEQIRSILAERADAASKDWNEATASDLANRLSLATKVYDRKKVPNEADLLALETPLQRAMTEIVQLISAEELAKIPNGLRQVWATDFTPMQHPLPRSAWSVIDRLVTRQEQWTAATRRKSIELPRNGPALIAIPGVTSVELPDKPTKILVSVRAWPNALGVELILPTEGAMHRFHANFEVQQASRKQVASGKFLLTPYEAKLFWQSRFPTPDGVGLTGEVKQKLLSPEKVDPLSFIASPALLETGKLKDKNVIAWLCDDAFAGAFPRNADRVDVEQYLADVARTTSCQDEGNWLVCRPTMRSLVPASFSNRQALGAILRRVTNGPHLSIEEQQTMTVRMPLERSSYLLFDLLSMLPQRDDVYLTLNDGLDRLYGMLSDTQRRMLSARGLSFSGLSQAQKAWLTEFVFSKDSFERPIEGDHPAKPSLSLEPTEAFPRGIPGEALISSEEDVKAAWFVKDSRGAFLEMSPKTIAFMQIRREFPERFETLEQEIGKPADVSQLRAGRERKLKIRLQLDDRYSLNKTLRERMIEARPTSLDAMPAQFRAEVKSAYAAYKKTYGQPQPGKQPPP